ncbi:unnamed protein product [Leptosia nina]|uniref:Uncharacterized protein n=1 Tax=Leptosia nina TaxID=320188 RepID=A0AAV1J1E0_9NEOP
MGGTWEGSTKFDQTENSFRTQRFIAAGLQLKSAITCEWRTSHPRSSPPRASLASRARHRTTYGRPLSAPRFERSLLAGFRTDAAERDVTRNARMLSTRPKRRRSEICDEHLDCSAGSVDGVVLASRV